MASRQQGRPVDAVRPRRRPAHRRASAPAAPSGHRRDQRAPGHGAGPQGPGAPRVALVQQLEAHLARVFPGAVTLFDDLASDIARAFLLRFPSADRAAWLGPRRLAAGWWPTATAAGAPAPSSTRASRRRPGAWAARRRRRWPRSRPPSCGPSARSGAGRGPRGAHHRAAAGPPDGRIFTSLPRSGRVRAAALLAEIGDCRERFPSRVAGVPRGRDPDPPVGRAPGGGLPLVVRQAAAGRAHRLRRRQPSGNPWADDLYRRARARGKTHPHAVRILARAWVHVIWRCWQDGVPYDPSRHHGLQRVAPAQAA